MARIARRKSSTGIYHAMVRGIDRQLIFRNAADYEKFLCVLQECKHISQFELYAYCLMSNHVHLLIREGPEDLGKIFQRIGVRYASWFNRKYDRCGHLFQDRFKSEPVNDDRYFLTVLRYIHRNPVAAGLCRKVADYGWSSYGEFADDEVLIDINYPLSLFSDKRRLAFSSFIAHVNNEEKAAQCLELPPRSMLALVQDAPCASPQVCAKLTENAQALQRLKTQGIDARNQSIRELRSKGASIRQIASQLNVSTWTVRKA